MTVYVYGTLRKGGIFHNVLKECPFLGVYKVNGYKMVDLGSYPAAVSSKADKITCEKYEVTQEVLHRLDQIEGYPSFYDRETVDDSYIYVIHPWKLSSSPKIESGDWVEHLKQKEDN